MKTPRTHSHPRPLPFLAALLLPCGAAAGAEVTIEREIHANHHFHGGGDADWSDDATVLPYETYYLNEFRETRHRVPHIFVRQ